RRSPPSRSIPTPDGDGKRRKVGVLIEPEAAGSSLTRAIRIDRLDSRADLNPSARRRRLRNRRHGRVSSETRPCQRNGAGGEPRVGADRLQRVPNSTSNLVGTKGVVAVTGFKHPALAQLTDQQVRFAPPARRLEQRERAEKLLGEIDPAKQYPYQFVC